MSISTGSVVVVPGGRRGRRRIVVEHDRSGNVTVRSFARELEDDDTRQGLLGVLGARDGGEFGADLDGGRDDVLGALAAGLGRMGAGRTPAVVRRSNLGVCGVCRRPMKIGDGDSAKSNSPSLSTLFPYPSVFLLIIIDPKSLPPYVRARCSHRHGQPL